MPIYEYQCQNELCAHRSEIRVSFENRQDSIKCTECGESSVLVISKTADPQFRGTGFYKTDYKK